MLASSWTFGQKGRLGRFNGSEERFLSHSASFVSSWVLCSVKLGRTTAIGTLSELRANESHEHVNWSWLEKKNSSFISEDNTRMIHLFGEPGIGKITIATYLVEQSTSMVEHSHSKTLAYYFVTTSTKTKGQLYQSSENWYLNSWNNITSFCKASSQEKESEKLSNSIDTLWRDMANVLGSLKSHTRLFIDASNECRDVSTLDPLQCIAKFLKDNKSVRAKFILISRPNKKNRVMVSGLDGRRTTEEVQRPSTKSEWSLLENTRQRWPGWYRRRSIHLTLHPRCSQAFDGARARSSLNDRSRWINRKHCSRTGGYNEIWDLLVISFEHLLSTWCSRRRYVCQACMSVGQGFSAVCSLHSAWVAGIDILVSDLIFQERDWTT